MKNHITFLFVFMLISTEMSWAQVVFSEDIGTPNNTTSISSNTFQNNGLLTYSNGFQTNAADIRKTYSSSEYSNASAGGNVFFTSASGSYGFSIESVNATNYSSLTLQYGYRKEAASVHANFSVDYWNGSSWIVLANSPTTLFNESANATAKWYLAKTLTLPADAQINSLKIRFVKTGNTAIRIDDIILTGTERVAPTVINSVVSSLTNNSATFGGNVTATGGSSITATGSVYCLTSTNSNPTLGALGVTEVYTSNPNSSTGVFSNNTETVLLSNVQYSYNAFAVKDGGAMGYGSVATFYTLASTPTAPILSNITSTSITVSIGTDSNSNSTTYAIFETTTNSYVQQDGTLGTSALYLTANNWENKTVTGLTPETTYTFQTKAKNEDDIVTSYGASSNGTTLIVPNALSDIVFNSSSSTSNNTNINYLNYQAETITNTINSVGVMGFYLRDGGVGHNDADNLGTELSAISFDVTNGSNIRSARLFVGNSPRGISIPVNGTSTITFTDLTNIVADDGDQLAINLRVTFNTTVTDNEQIQFAISSVTANSAGSQFALANGGGASSSIVGDVNRIEVTASKLEFTQQPPESLFTDFMMNPYPIVSTLDENENLDLDYTEIVTLNSTGTLSNSQTINVSEGIATFNNFNFLEPGTGIVMTANSLGLISAESSAFSIIIGPIYELINNSPGVIELSTIDHTNCQIASCNNLIVNGNFEEFNMIPNNINQVDNACGWAGYYSPDYFHSASPNPNTTIPCNFIGGENSNNNQGNAYAGFYASNLSSEIIVSRLSLPLISGANYQLRFDVSLAEGCSVNSKAVQAYFSQDLLAPSPLLPINNPQLLIGSTVTSTVTNGWETLTFNFTANGGEEYIYLGCFENIISMPQIIATNTNCIYNNGPNSIFPSLQYSYYYIDNVRLVPVDIFITSNDSFAVTPSSATTNSVIVNDTFGGNPITSIPPAINYTITLENPLPTITSGGITLNSDGTFTVQPDTPFGSYNFNYSITTNCGVSNVSSVTIIYSDDYVKHPGKLEFQFCFNPSGYQSAVNGTQYTSLFDLGTVGGVPANSSNATINLITPPDASFTINLDGTFIISPNVEIPGVVSVTYPFTYEICSGGFCSTEILGYATIENSVQALPDPITFFTEGNVIPSINVLTDDIKWDCFNPTPISIGDVVITQITPDNGVYWINTSTGDINYNEFASIGVYTIGYKICDSSYPLNCSISYVKIHHCDPTQPSNPNNPCYFGRISNPSTDKIDLNPIVITPNPSESKFEIIFDNELVEESTCEVYDVFGKKIINTFFRKGVKSSFVNLENYPKGIYLFRIKIGVSIINKKLIKK